MKFPQDLLKECWFLAGPTAVGKTSLGVELAKAIDGEIISLDSMAVFRNMDIGTAKPSASEQKEVNHHLIDVAEPHEEFSTAEYLRQSIQVCEEILARQHVPIFVGGTGLYLRAILRGVFEGPEANWDLRNELQREARHQGGDWLHQKLYDVDTASAARIHPNDTRRLIRALEIFHETGVPASQLQEEGPLPALDRPQHVYWLHPDRDWIYKRINSRVELMIEQGLEDEVRQLLERTPPIGRTARQALGYREMIDWIEGRLTSRDKVIELIQTRTRQFAKRQHTWFRNLEECEALELLPDQSVIDLRDRLLAKR